MATATGRDLGSVKPRKRATDAELGFPQKPTIEAKTDPTRWRLKDDDSRHSWLYLESEKEAKDWPQSYAEKYFLGLPLVRAAKRFKYLLIKLASRLADSISRN